MMKTEKNVDTLWYCEPSREGHAGWEQDALPIGNGDLGCKIFGNVSKERIQMNEKVSGAVPYTEKTATQTATEKETTVRV